MSEPSGLGVETGAPLGAALDFVDTKKLETPSCPL